jgi:anionic cell wall polymer biosynthesis LytR-Cps2A-Psr (LCP) family protein
MTQGAEILLTDEQAEKFVRARMAVGDGTNRSRLGRQRQYMENMYRQVHTRLSDNASYINDLYKELRTILDTDQPDKTISELAVKIRDCEYVGILTPDGESARGQMLDDGETHSEFYVDEASIAENLGKIIDLRDATDEAITEDEMDILQDDFSEDEEISLE